MPKTVTARIPVIVTADGKWAAQGCNSYKDGDTDWSWLDEMCDSDNPTICPQRMWITVELPLPQVGEVIGMVEPTETDTSVPLPGTGRR